MVSMFASSAVDGGFKSWSSQTKEPQRFSNMPVRRTNPVKINSVRKNIGVRYKILDLLYKRSLFDLQFVHNLFWLKLKWNAISKLFYCIIYRSSMLWWSSRTLTKLKSQSLKRCNEQKYYTIDDFRWGEYKDWSTYGTWYSPRHPRWISCSMGWSILVFTEIESH